MNSKWKKISVVASVAGIMMLYSGCDDTSALLNALFSFPQDPPDLYTIVGSATSTPRLVRIAFNRFGIGYHVYNSSVVVHGPSGFLAAPRFGPLAASPQGGGTLDPDPDEHEFDPDLLPDPDDEFPLPDPPLPLPDYPDEGPLDGLPEPPLFDPAELGFTDISDGSLTSVNTGGGEQLVQAIPGYPQARIALPRDVAPRSSVTGKILIGAQPAGIATSYDRSITLVALFGEASVAILQNRAVVGKIPLPSSAQPYGIAMTQDGTRAYVTNFVRNAASVLVLDVPNRKVIATLPIGSFPAGIAITPDGSQVWVTSLFQDSVTIVDTLTNTQVTQISGVANGWGIAFNPAGTRAYVAGSDVTAGGLYVIDATYFKILSRIKVGDGPRSVVVSPTGRHVFVTNRNSNFISQIDARTNTLLRNIVVGPGAEGIRFVK